MSLRAGREVPFEGFVSILLGGGRDLIPDLSERMLYPQYKLSVGEEVGLVFHI
jgi:hypothetical protein